MSDDPAHEASALARVRRTVVLVLAFVVPSAVIALSVFFIVRGGPRRDTLMLAPSSSVEPAPALASSATSLAPAAPTDGAQVAEAVPGAAVSADEAGADEEGIEDPAKPSKPTRPKHFDTVQLAALGSCSTESVDGLSRQIIDQARCIKPNDFVALPKRSNLNMAAHVYPYLEQGARDHLLKALAAHSNETMTINSALRTVAQQYLVWHWAATKICGVQLATQPGDSNHELGSALDIAEAAKWRPALEAQDFRWLGKSDRVHFDYKPAAASGRTATDVLAFQKLWNRNHREDAIAENGRYSPALEQRLKKAPASGFPLGASCKH